MPRMLVCLALVLSTCRHAEQAVCHRLVARIFRGKFLRLSGDKPRVISFGATAGQQLSQFRRRRAVQAWPAT